MPHPALKAKPPSPVGAYGLIALLFALGAALVAQDLASRIPPALWLPALLGQTEGSAAAALVHYNVLPRVAMCCLVGAALGLCGLVMQQVLRNPLAEPTTLGVSSGAGLALGIAQIWVPSLLEGGAALVSLAGAVVAFAAVAALAWRRGLSPIAMILAGLVIGLYAGAVGSALILFNHDYLIGLFIWGAGYMTQHDWSAAARLAPQFVAVALLVALMARPLAVLGLDDETARNLGLGLNRARAVVLGASVFLAASVVSVVGIIGFVGLAAPAMARYAGARTLRQRLVAAPLLGSALLLLADRLVLLVPQGYREVPTGSVTALFGAPLILIMIARLRGDLAPERGEDTPFRRRRDLGHLLPWMAGALVLVLALALVVAPGPQGWRLLDTDTLSALFPWRWPRVLGALSCGVLLGVAGTLLQRLTGNAMAGPETLGITSGAAIGVVVLLYAQADASPLVQTAAGALGALASLLLVLVISRRSGFNPERLLLTGVATSIAFAGTVSLFASTGDPRLASVLTWLSGSTYGIDGTASFVLAASAALALALAVLLARPLALLSLGAAPAAAAGLDLRSARLLVVLLAGAASAAATLVIGPLSFIGLMAPHIARSLGLARLLDHLIGAALVGAVILTAADWAGRVAIFPYQIPAGLAATLIAGPWLIGLLLRRG